MAKQRVLIEISATRLEVALLRGDTIAKSVSVRLNLPGYAESWPGVLDSIKPDLTRLISELGVAGAQATVLYAGPTATTGVFACAEAAGTTGASRAARLALAEAAGFALDSNPHDLERLTTDKPAAADTGLTPQMHTLGIADTEATAQALANWITQAGLEAFSLIPIDVPGTIAAVDAALRLATGSQVALVLFAGEQTSSLAAASAGRLRFIRQIAIGTESLVAALARGVRAGNEGATIALDAAVAAELVFASGIPERAQTFDAARGIMGDAVLPLVQPILQRCVVDIKQSLRFGLEEKERETAVLHGIGPGARIPRLMKLIGEQTALAAGKAEQPELDRTAGNLTAWAHGRQIHVNLLPRGLRAQMTGRRMRRGLWVGVAAALALVGADMTLTRMDLTEEEAAAAKLKQRLEAAKPATTLQEKLAGTQAGVEAARQRVGQKLNTIGTWDAAMNMLSRQTPPNIRLSQVHFSYDDGKAMCRLVGHAPLGAQSDSNSSLRAYMDALTAVPIVRVCRLGATQRGESDHGPVQNFEMSLSLIELPAQPHVPASSLTEAAETETQR